MTIITPQQRQKYLEFQRIAFKEKTNKVIRMVKEERFQIADDHQEYHKAFLCFYSVDFGILMCLTTRKKIHAISYEALKKMRNYNDDVDISRLKKLISIHKNQLRKTGTSNYGVNAKFYDSMYDSIEHNLRWLRVIKCG